MKKLLAIVVISLLWFGNAFAEEVLTFPIYVHIVEIDEKEKGLRKTQEKCNRGVQSYERT